MIRTHLVENMYNPAYVHTVQASNYCKQLRQQYFKMLENIQFIDQHLTFSCGKCQYCWYCVGFISNISAQRLRPWMKEEKGIRHRGKGPYLRCPVSTSVQFSLRNEGSSEYICVCEGRESLMPNF
jgi:hypothetical protein